MYEVKLLTFKTNQTIICDLEYDELNQLYKVKKPVQVIVVPPRDSTDPGGLAFSPFLQYSKEFETGFTFSVEDVLVVSSPVRELENQYNSVFGSGITIASSLPT